MLAKLDWNPDRKLLASFSQWGLFFLGMVACPLALYRGHLTAAMVFWALAVSLRLLAFVRPEWLRPIYVGLMLLSFPIGWVVSHMTLAVIYYLVFTPVAIVFRLLGRDALNRSFDRHARSYWEPYRPDQGLARYLRQF